MVKKLVEKTKHDLVMFLGDDTRPEKDFLKNAIKEMGKIKDGWGLVGLNDGHFKRHERPTHWLASKKLLPLIDGEFFHTGYIHQYCDNELYSRVRGLNRYKFAEDAKIFHDHPVFEGKGATPSEKIRNSDDEDYKRVYSHDVEMHDKNLYYERMRQINNMAFTGERVVLGDMRQYVPTLQEHIARYNFAMHFCTDKKVLDAACGSGYGSNLLLEAADEVHGWDVSEEAIKHARTHYRGSYEVHNLEGDLPDTRFDTIVSFETIEHLDDPGKFLTWVKDHCDQFIFSIPVNNGGDFHKKLYSVQEIVDLSFEYWKNVEFFSQAWIRIDKGINNKYPFIIGIAS